MLSNLTVRAKLILLASIPLIIAIYYGASTSLSAYEQKTEMQRINALVELGSKMSALVHESQKERGMTAGYIGSKGQKFVEKLPEQQQLFNEKRQQLLTALGEFDKSLFGAELQNVVDSSLQHLAQTDQVRTQVKALNIPLGKALGHYTHLNKLMIGNLEFLTKISSNAEVTSSIVAFTNFLQSKERAGIERAVLTGTFSADKFAPGFYKKFVGLVTAQDVYVNVFLANASNDNIEFFQQAMSDPSVKQVADMRATANEKSATGGFDIEAGHWFATITKKINKLKEVEDFLTANVLKATQKISSNATDVFAMAIAVLVISVLLVLMLAVFIVRNIQQAVENLKNAMAKIEKTGDFSTKITVQGKDEFADISRGFSQLMAHLKSDIGHANEVLAQVANGDFSSRMTNQAHGDLLLLKEGVNGSAESVDFMMSQLNLVMDGLSRGQFNIRMDSKVPESFRNKVDNTLEIISQAISEISVVMNDMQRGSYSSRIHSEVPGQLDQMKQAINAAMANLEQGIKEISCVMEHQAKGDLTQRVTNEYQGALNDLKNAINSSLQQTHGAITQVNQTTDLVKNRATGIASGSGEISARIQEQAAALEETAAAMEEISSTVHQSTSLAEQASKLVTEASVESVKGSKVMSDTIVAMERINEVSLSITEIIALIDNIAFQTNLLALNAAVEAARAGEHGRGFAVVASEVRNLAGRSADAAKEIKELIERTNTEVTAGTELVKSSGEALTSINQYIDKVSVMVDEINSGAKEQALGIDQVNNTISTVDQNTQQNALLVDKSASSSEDMSSQAENLNVVVQKFKL